MKWTSARLLWKDILELVEDRVFDVNSAPLDCGTVEEDVMEG